MRAEEVLAELSAFDDFRELVERQKDADEKKVEKQKARFAGQGKPRTSRRSEI